FQLAHRNGRNAGRGDSAELFVIDWFGDGGRIAAHRTLRINLRGTLGRFAPELLQTEFAREMWALFEQGELTADSTLKGVYARDETAADPDAVLLAVEDAREEALRRELGRES